MCGIAGIIAFDEDSKPSKSTVRAMADAVVHRGPDGAGEWFSPDERVGLCHRRLSIIDLSDGATQPMCNEDHSVWITFNGEIYNHQQLRAELKESGHTFATDHSDTESIVHGYEEWGLEGLLARLEGDFAFAIWDIKRGMLSIARDRVGVKPLYFYEDSGQFAFASEIKSLLKNPRTERDVEPIALFHYLTFMTTPAPLTMFKGIFKLPAGHAMTVTSDGQLTAWRYWDAEPGRSNINEATRNLTHEKKELFLINGIRDRLERSIEKRMMSDVPFGVFLSGGVDSSTNVALMSRLMTRPVDTFTVGFKDFKHLNELDYARRVADQYGTNHREVMIDERDMFNYLEQLVHHQDEPLADWVCIPLYFVSKLAKDSGITVIQVGEGADEQFCGYASYMGYLELYRRYWSPFQKYAPKTIQKAVASCAKAVARKKPSFDVYADIIDRASRDREHFWTGAIVFWNIMKDKLVDTSANWEASFSHRMSASGLLPEKYSETDSYNVIDSFLSPFDARHPNQDPLTRMIHNEFKLRLPELLLMRVDKITMSESLEARVPFLDHELVDFTMDIPQHMKVQKGEAKYLLKKAVEDLLPHDIIYRKKMGFAAPMADWLRGEFGAYAKEKIMKSRLLDRGFFKRSYVTDLIEGHRSGATDNSLYIWTIFNVTSWYDYWIDS